MGEVVTWLVQQEGLLSSILKFLELGAILVGAIVAFRKWIMKPVVDMIDENRRSVIMLEEDYTQKRNEVLSAVESLKDEICKIDQRSEERHEKLRHQFKDMRDEMGTVQDDVADVLGNELEMGHQKFMAQGWCSPAEKKHFVDLHKRYAERGHNHLAQHYEEDLLELPDHPPAVYGDING